MILKVGINELVLLVQSQEIIEVTDVFYDVITVLNCGVVKE